MTRIAFANAKSLAAFNILSSLQKSFSLVLLFGVAAGCSTYHGRVLQHEMPSKYAMGDPQFIRSMNCLLEAGFTQGNAVTAFVNGEQIYTAMLAAISNAQTTVNLETYIFTGTVAQHFSDVLAERARTGVSVHLLLDWFGSRSCPVPILKQMTDAGVDVRFYNTSRWFNIFRINQRDHRKLLIVDGQIGFTGSANIEDIEDGNADSPQHWRSSHYRLVGPVVGQMQAAFMDNWMRVSGHILDGNDYFPELKPAGTIQAQMFTSSPRGGTESVDLMYLLSIAAARRNIRIANAYFIPDALMMRELEHASRRGVTVEILVPGPHIDVSLVRSASRAYWGPLLQAGVRLYEYQPTMYHGKVMIVDDVWVSVGSSNFDPRSFQLNDEANLNILSSEFAKLQCHDFEADKTQSREISYAAWQKRSPLKKIQEFLTLPFRSRL